jgi:cellulose synthase/poly-beta-1,6-N-acetylglucosamine synthase-like glycosyltransferase
MTAYEPVSSPLVSIIVPARNEEASLGACLKSLIAQTGVNFEVIVVNDHSTDHTAEIARSFSSVRLIDAPELPAGWTGKNNAVAAGAKAARGAWFLFTDADTVHLPGSLAKALAEAQQHRAALLSYSPEQEAHSFAEKALMPVIFAELAANFRPKDVSNPASPAAAANGQYLLITREAYEAVGGHAAIAGNILEDVALAQAVKSAGFKIFFRYGGDAVRTRMYRTFPQMREGWTKNLALLFPSAKVLAARRLAEFVLVLAGVIGAILFATKGSTSYATCSVILALLLYGVFLHRIRKAHFSASANLCAFAGLPLFSYLLWRSDLFHRRGKVEWKGRAYASKPADVRPEAKQNQALLASPLAKHKSNF